MSNDFLTGRTRANGSKGSVSHRQSEPFWGNDQSGRQKRQTQGGSGKGNFIAAQTEMRNLNEELVGLLGSASNTVSGYAMSIIRGDEAPSQNNIEQNLAALLNGFSTEQQRDILLKALAKVAVNA